MTGDDEVAYGLLGPLEVHRGEAAVAVTAGRQRALLAALVLAAGRRVGTSYLIEVLWDEAPPPSALVTVQNYVVRLRRVLGSAAIVTEAGGYRVEVGPGRVDVGRLEAALAAGRAASKAGDWAGAARALREGLALWRGEPLAGVDSRVLAEREVPRLTELRWQAAELHAEAELCLGRHRELVTGLRALVAEAPLRERLRALLMTALFRDGQQAAALAAYHDARRVLAEELGTDPGAGLQELHGRILAADPALTVLQPAPPSPGGPGVPVPRQLPAGVAHFIGRAAELAALTRLAGLSSGTVVVSAISGMGGVGKTALAVQWAHRAAERFPGGQLYVNLRGYDPGDPVSPGDALAGFLRALGVAGQDIPADEDERAARYRSLLAERRVLVVLDNASSAAQVRPLLPGSPGCAAIVTSRDSLPGLVARDGAARLDLDLLPLAEASGLLRSLIGERADADPAAVTALAGQCGRLPLALRVAAELAAARPGVPLAGLVAELADQQQRLDLLDSGEDARTAVRAVFSWSYQYLGEDAARLFRLLGLHPGADLDAYGAAALTGAALRDAGGLLGLLARAHLVQAAGPGRYLMHDLLRAYARELAADRDGEGERDAAMSRLIGYYLHTAAAAMDTLLPADRPRRPRITTPAPPAAPLVATSSEAQAWLDGQRAALVAVTEHAAGHGWPGHAAQLAATISRYLEAGGYHAEAVTVHTCAAAAARLADDPAGEAAALANLGIADARQGRGQQAADRLEEALALCQRSGDRVGEARAWTNLGFACFQLGRYRQAAGHHQHALDLHRGSGDLTGQARALNHLGLVEERLGQAPEAIEHFRQSLYLYRQGGNQASEPYPLGNLGWALRLQGRWQEAAEYAGQAVLAFREAGNRGSEAYARGNLGDVWVAQGRCEEAMTEYRQALELFRRIGDRPGQALALNGLGDALRAAGHASRAGTAHAAALDLAGGAGDLYEQARAHDGLADCSQAAGDDGQARQHWEQALLRYDRLQLPQAARIRARLGVAASGTGR